MSDQRLFKLTEAQRDSIQIKLRQLKLKEAELAASCEVIASQGREIVSYRASVRRLRFAILGVTVIAAGLFLLAARFWTATIDLRSQILWIERIDSELDAITLAEFSRSPKNKRKLITDAAARRILKWQVKHANQMIHSEWNAAGLGPNSLATPVGVYADFYQALLYPDAIFKDYPAVQSQSRP